MRLDRGLLAVEAERKLFHAAWAIDPLLYYFGYPRDGMILLIACQLLIWTGLEAARRKGYSVFSPSYMRPNELNGSVIGTLFQVASLLLAVLLFDKPIAVLAMLFNCFGDSAVGLAGAALYTYIGKEKIIIRDFEIGARGIGGDIQSALRHHKSPILMGVMFLVCVVPGFIMYPGIPVGFITAGALGAVIADSFAWKLFGHTLNDDLTITLAAGGAMALAAYL